MNVYNNPAKESWKELIQRPQLELGFLESSVRNILNRVRKSGDQALRELTLQFDKVNIEDIEVAKEEMNQARRLISADLKTAIQTAVQNITKFHDAQKRDTIIIETMPGVKCWRKAVPITKVGIYIP